MHIDRLHRLERLVHLLDHGFPLGKTKIRVGLDPLLGLIPGVGDLVGVGFAGYIIYEAHQLGASKWVVLRMILNAGADFLIGLVPVLGDYADFVYQSNTKNLRLLKKHLERIHK